MIHHRKYSNRLIAALASLALWLTSTAPLNAQNPYLRETSFDAGNVRQGDPVEHAFVMRNPGSSALILRIIAISHPGMKVRMPQEIPPGGTGRILVTWDTQLVQGDSTAEALVRLNEAENIYLNLSARVIPPVEVLPYPAVFISGFRDEGATRSVEIVNHDREPLNIVGVSGERTDWEQSYSITFRTIEPGRRQELKVELKRSAQGGRSSDALMVRTDHPRFTMIRIPVNLFVKEDVYINPESVDFGQITAKAWSPETFLLKTHHGSVKVLSVASDLPFIKVTTPSTDAAATHEFRVEIDGNPVRGPFSGNISIRTDDPAFPEIKARVYGEIL